MFQPFLKININCALILSNIIGTGALAHKKYWRADLMWICICYVQAVAKKAIFECKTKISHTCRSWKPNINTRTLQLLLWFYNNGVTSVMLEVPVKLEQQLWQLQSDFHSWASLHRVNWIWRQFSAPNLDCWVIWWCAVSYCPRPLLQREPSKSSNLVHIKQRKTAVN